jgi:hypothetical protein
MRFELHAQESKAADDLTNAGQNEGFVKNVTKK